MKKIFLLVVSHLAVAVGGFSLGIYALPIIIAPDSPTPQAIESVAQRAVYSGHFRRQLEDSDLFHWGEGELFIARDAIAMRGELAPGPAYKLYLSPGFVETENAFKQLKPRMALVGDIDTFDNFLLKLSPDVDPEKYTTAVVWCESYSQFISAARYRQD